MQIISPSPLLRHDYIGNSMARAVLFIQRSFECRYESWQCKGVSLAIYIYGSDSRQNDAILAFTFCSRVLFEINMAEK